MPPVSLYCGRGPFGPLRVRTRYRLSVDEELIGSGNDYPLRGHSGTLAQASVLHVMRG